MRETILAVEQIAEGRISIYEEPVGSDFFTRQDLMLISLDSWKKAVDEQPDWLTYIPSSLLLKP